MSEQNSMAISPVTAGLAGAAIGGVGNYFLDVGAKPEKGYRDTKELLTLPNDKFEALKKKIDDSDNDGAKTEFKKLEDGRVTVTAAGDELVKSQNEAKKAMPAAIEKAVADGKISVEAKAEKDALDEVTGKVKKVADDLKAARKDANSDLAKAIAEYRKKYDEAVEGLSKELKELEGSKAGKTGDELAKIEKDIKAKKNAISKKALENNDVKTAQTAMRDKKKAIFNAEAETNAKAVNGKKDAYRNKLVENLESNDTYKNATANKDAADGTIEKLKHQIAEWKETLAKKADDVKGKAADELIGENGKLKDLDTGKFKKFLPKAKMMPALIGAAILGAAGVALAYIVGPKNQTPTDVA